jgi:ABC-type transporter Mla subunit MlaD
MAARRRQTVRVLLGLALIVAIVGGATLVFFLDDIVRAVQGRVRLIAIVEDAPRVVPGAPVWLAGAEIGEVVRVELLPTTNDSLARVALTLLIPDDALVLVPRDSRVRLTSARMIGAPVIDIVPGTATSGTVIEGDTIGQGLPITLDRLLADAEGFRTTLDSIVTAGSELAGRAMARREVSARLQRSLERLSVQFDAFSTSLEDGAWARFRADTAFATALARIEETSARLGVVFSDEGAGEGRRELTRALAGVNARARSLSASIARLQAHLAESNGFLPRSARDSALIHAVARVRTEIDSLMAEARREPFRFVF